MGHDHDRYLYHKDNVVTLTPVHIATIPKGLGKNGMCGLVFRDDEGRRAVIYLTDQMYRTLEVTMMGGIIGMSG